MMSTMKRSVVLHWLALSAASMGAASGSAQPAGPGYQLSPDVRTSITAAQAAIAQNNFSGASGYLGQAQGVARTDGDRYAIAVLRLDVANRSYNQAQQIAAIDALIASPLISDSYRSDLYYHRGRFSFQAQDMEATRDALIEATQRGSTNPRVYVALADLYSRTNAHAQALGQFDRAVQLQTAAGQPVPIDWYRRAIDIAQRAGDVDRVTQLSQAMLAAYPAGRNWRDVLLVYRTNAALDPQQSLDSARLLSAVGGLAGERDYLDYAQLATAAEQRAEVERIVAAGRTANVIDSSNSEITALDRGTTRDAQALRGAIAGRATAAANAATGVDALEVADDYLGLGEYAQAAPLYQAALAKGGIDADLANLRLGMALAQSGQGDAARAALAAAGGRQAWLARFWTIYVASRVPAGAPVAAAAPAPAGGEPQTLSYDIPIG